MEIGRGRGEIEFEESAKSEVAYWRKHPNLHGFIVQTFADGVDKCQRIFLTAADVDRIIAAVRENRLPHTDGFFFGSSDWADPNEDVVLLKRAQDALADAQVIDPSASLYYQASW
jgi:hypothetical protein